MILHTKGQLSVSQYPDTKSTGVWFEKKRLLSYWVMENILLCNKKILSQYKHVPVQISALWVDVFGYWCIFHVFELPRTEKREPSSLNRVWIIKKETKCVRLLHHDKLYFRNVINMFLKQILSAFICRTLYFSSMFSLGAMSDFVERGKFCAWQNSSKFSRNFWKINPV